MLRVGTIENYTITYAEDINEPNHAIIAEITPSNKEEISLFGEASLVKVAIPKIPGITDYTDLSIKYNLLVIVDDEANFDDTILRSVPVFLLPKDIGGYNADTTESSDMKQILDDSDVKSAYNVIRSPDGQSSISVSNNSIVLKSGSTRFVITDGKIIKMCQSVDYNSPDESRGVVKESGFLRLFPKCFIPPFSFPDYMPDPDMIIKVALMVKVIKDLKKDLK